MPMRVPFLLHRVIIYSWVVLIRPEIQYSSAYLKNNFMNGNMTADS
jgi:hypothetical protein